MGALPAQPRRTDLGDGDDEERDYMYRMYAHVDQARLNLGIRRRLAPLLNNDRKSIELLNALLFSLPGTPVLYYGDEIGLGENIFLGDRNGVRTPMQWSSDKNAGFPAPILKVSICDHSGSRLPLRSQQRGSAVGQCAFPALVDAAFAGLRKTVAGAGRGKCEFLQTDNRKILSYISAIKTKHCWSWPTSPLSAAGRAGFVPVPAFGPNRTVWPDGIPVDQRAPLFLSLGPHSFYWFSLETKLVRGQVQPSSNGEITLPKIAVSQNWEEIITGRNRPEMRDILPDYLRAQPWFQGRFRTIKLLSFRESVPVRWAGGEAQLAFLQVDYVDSDTETYSMPLAFASGAEAEGLRQHFPHRIIAEVTVAAPAQNGILYDAFVSPDFCAALLEMIGRPRRVKAAQGEIEAVRLPELRRIMGDAAPPKPSPARTEQSNSSVVFEDKLALKLFRRLQQGLNPELEVGRFLNNHSFPHCQTVVGGLEYVGPGDFQLTLAIVHAFSPRRPMAGISPWTPSAAITTAS